MKQFRFENVICDPLNSAWVVTSAMFLFSAMQKMLLAKLCKSEANSYDFNLLIVTFCLSGISGPECQP